MPIQCLAHVYTRNHLLFVWNPNLTGHPAFHLESPLPSHASVPGICLSQPCHHLLCWAPMCEDLSQFPERTQLSLRTHESHSRGQVPALSGPFPDLYL